MTFHEARINAHGWSGYGYTIADPETGAGAYLIEGKGNGAYFLGVLNGFSFVAFLAGVSFGAPFILAATLGVLVAASMIATAIAVARAEDPNLANCYAQGFNDGIDLYAISALILALKIKSGSPDPKTALLAGIVEQITEKIYSESFGDC